MAEQPQQVLPGIETVQPSPKRKGGRRKAPEAIALSEHIAFRATKSDRARLEAAAQAAGVPVGVFLRQRLLADLAAAS